MTGPLCPVIVLIRRPLATSQTRNVASNELLTRHLPSLENAMSVTHPLCPRRTWTSAPRWTSHNPAQSSYEAVAIRAESGENATALTHEPCQARTRTPLQFDTRQRRTVRSWDA